MPAVPETKATWVNNVDALSSTNLHAYLRDPLRFLMRRPIAKLRQGTVQTLGNNMLTPVNFQLETVDSDVDGVGGHSTSTNISRYTARYPGWYRVSGGCSWAANATGIRLLRWLLNGSPVPGTDVLVNGVNGNTTRLATRSELIPLAEGDYLELGALQSSGGNLATVVAVEEQATFNIVWEAML